MLNDTWLVRHKALSVEYSPVSVGDRGTIGFAVVTFHGYEVTDGNPPTETHRRAKSLNLFHRLPAVGIASEISDTLPKT